MFLQTFYKLNVDQQHNISDWYASVYFSSLSLDISFVSISVINNSMVNLGTQLCPHLEISFRRMCICGSVRGCERFWSYWYPLLNSFEKWQYKFHPHQGLAVSISQSPHQPLHPSQWVWEEKPPVRPMEWGPRGLGKVELVWRCKGNSPEGGSQFPGNWLFTFSEWKGRPESEL